MPDLTPLEVGVMFWAERDDLREIRALGVRAGQLGIPGGMALSEAVARDWKAALDREDFRLATVFAAYEGESYADLETVRRTVGFIPRATREERERRTLEVSDFAAVLGVGTIACHIGFVPDDTSHPDYIEVRSLVRRICNYAARHDQGFALETGQETASALVEFINDVDRPNLFVNFDPANMVLYGTGDPIQAFRRLSPYVVSVHAKDGDWPERPGTLGRETPLGRGAVGVEKLVQELRRVNFRGLVSVEREGAADHAGRLRDIRQAIELLKKLGAAERT